MISLKRNSGFTVLELLSMIAILAILAAILFPVFAKASARGALTIATCQSNLKQIGRGFHMYANDYDDTLPVFISGRWNDNLNDSTGAPLTAEQKACNLMNVLGPYIRTPQVWECPSDMYVEGISPALEFSSGKYGKYGKYCKINGRSYFRNFKYVCSYYDVSIGGGPRKFRSMPRLSAAVLMADTVNFHSGGFNYLYGDGHVKYWSPGNLPEFSARSDTAVGGPVLTDPNP